ncbi:MAG: DNA topoisomerase 4 subunit A [Patescibacteria group bacterium]|nr:DNA topoisomerase 4 subunit A [Patescibacteria group bacterium]
MKEKIIQSEITNELKTSYLDYALSVIVSRAIPDARDGLKPVQRRILFVMKELGLDHNAKYMKCARIVGDVLGKYHPHGDAATYETLVRLAQDFSLRSPLVDGQGNFGSIDGDPAAAYRYTEARLTEIAEEMITELDKETVDFMPNYDNTKKEPKVLPAKIPNLIVNGNLGIAVGMTTNIPPHNLKEVCSALTFLVDNQNGSLKEILKLIQGPDFPSAGIIYDRERLAEVYQTGRGRIVIRGRYKIEQNKRGDERVVLIELPYQVNKAELVRQIAELSLAKTLPQIKDVRDESNKEGVRVVIELRENQAAAVVEKLYRLTDFQKNFSINLVALEHGVQPKLYDLKSILLEWLDHRKEVITRRTKFELEKVKDRIHLLEGFKKALDKIDLVIRLIRNSKDKDEAKSKLIKNLSLSERQAESILEMPLRTLTNLEKLKIETELKEKLKLQKELEEILASRKKLEGVLKKEIEEIKTKYGDERRTEIVNEKLEEETEAESIADEDVLVFIDAKEYVSTFPIGTPVEKLTKEKDNFGQIILARTTEKLWLLTKKGRIYQVPIYNFYQNQKYLEAEISLNHNDQILKTFKVERSDRFLFLATKNGLGKKIAIADCLSQKKTGLQIIKLKKNDEVAAVATYNQGDLILLTRAGFALSFKDDLTGQTRSAAGVKMIKLKDDEVFDLVVRTNKELVLVFDQGFVKKIDLDEIKLQRRGGLGIKVFEPGEKIGKLIFSQVLSKEDQLLAIDDKISTLTVKDLPLLKRVNQPKKLIGKIKKINVLKTQ